MAFRWVWTCIDSRKVPWFFTHFCDGHCDVLVTLFDRFHPNKGGFPVDPNAPTETLCVHPRVSLIVQNRGNFLGMDAPHVSFDQSKDHWSVDTNNFLEDRDEFSTSGSWNVPDHTSYGGRVSNGDLIIIHNVRWVLRHGHKGSMDKA